MSLRRKIFYTITIATVAILLVLPTTGWLVRLQLMPKLSSDWGVSGLLFMNNTAAMDAALRKVPKPKSNDFDLQYAYALQLSSTEGIKRLENLETHFPNRPETFAAKLRLWTTGPVRIQREEEITHLEVEARQRGFKPVQHPRPLDMAIVARFDAAAEKGEQLDPNNGYFPAMRAMGYFAAHKDAEALAAWKRASEKTDWNEYISDEATAKWKLLRSMNGGDEVGFIGRMSYSASILLPHLAQLRASARLATVKAFETELAGNTEEGFALRRATRRIGETMQNHGKLYIGNLVGISIAAIPAQRPGGAPAIEIKSENSQDNLSLREKAEMFAPRHNAYTAYLRRIGHPEEAEAFTKLYNAGLDTKKIGAKAFRETYAGMGDNAFKLLAFWYADALLITGTLFALALGAIFTLIYRFSPRLQKGETLQKSARLGVIIGLAVPVITGLTLRFVPELGLVLPLVSLAILLIIPPVLLRFSARQFGHGMLVALATGASLAALWGVTQVVWHLFGERIGMIQMLQGMASMDDSGEVFANPSSAYAVYIPIISSLVLLSMPFLMILTFALFSRMLRIPVAAGVTRGMRSLAVPLACLLVFGWAACLVGTLKHENAAITELENVAQIGEVQTYANATHR